MDNALIADLLTLMGEVIDGDDRMRFKHEAEAGRALYYTHGGRITNTSRRLRISVPFHGSRIEQEDTIFTASGLKYPYPGGFALPDTYPQHEAALAAAVFLGQEDTATAAYLVRQAADREGIERRKRENRVLAFALPGKAGVFSIAADTLLILGRVIDTVRRHFADDTLHAYTQPHRGHNLVTVTVGEAWLQFVPLPVPETVIKERGVWRIDNPQQTLA